jgi:hypothetical protein
LPQALQDRGGWENRDTADAFAQYAGYVAEKLGDRARHFFTFNECWTFVELGHATGVFAPGLKLVNRIKAKRAIILLDTCESGALVEGQLRSRADASASEAAIGRLHEATGRPVLTAAATGRPAFEGYKEHGVFTWAILDALRNGDANGNGTIELMELVAHVQDKVPKISAELEGIGRAAVAVARASGFATSPQTPRFGSKGEDFIFGLIAQSSG